MSDGADIAVAVDDASFAYQPGVPVLQHCSVTVGRGRVLGILGPNGSGKTTLLGLMAHTLRPASGRVDVHGTVGLVPQLAHLSFAYSVLDVVLMGRARQIGLFAAPTSRDERAALEALGRVGLEAFEDRRFDTLSGGERQLVLFARALAADADVLVLDEPAAALDLAHQQMVLRRIRALARDDGLTVIFTTHQPQHADLVADDVALMFGPGEVQSGDARALLTPERLEALFGIGVRRVPDEGRSVLVPSWDV